MVYYKLTKIFFYVAPIIFVVYWMMVEAQRQHWGLTYFFIVTLSRCCIAIIFVKSFYTFAPKIIELYAKAYRERVKKQLLKSGEFVKANAEQEAEDSPQKHSKEDIKFKKILKYATSILSVHGFTTNDISILNKCIESFVIHREVITEPQPLIKKEGMKEKLTQQDLSHLGWNIAYVYSIKNIETAKFVSKTFHEWFEGREVAALSKHLTDSNNSNIIKQNKDILNEIKLSKEELESEYGYGHISSFIEKCVLSRD